MKPVGSSSMHSLLYLRVLTKLFPVLGFSNGVNRCNHRAIPKTKPWALVENC